jgi:hypothetical protein
MIKILKKRKSRAECHQQPSKIIAELKKDRLSFMEKLGNCEGTSKKIIIKLREHGTKINIEDRAFLLLLALAHPFPRYLM